LELIGQNAGQQLTFYHNSMKDKFGEDFADDFVGKPPPASCWVAEITGYDRRYGLSRSFLRGQDDYSSANSTGSRGVYRIYILESGRYYEVKCRITWKKDDRYFCKVTEAGEIIHVEQLEIDQWLNYLSE
jgi:hypothetical protein